LFITSNTEIMGYIPASLKTYALLSPISHV
jgi:hypothetical protein